MDGAIVAAQNIILSEILDISAGEALKADFTSAFAKRKPVSIDASKVRKLSTPCVQILVAASIEADRMGLSFSVTDPASVFSESFQSLGLSDYLGQWGK